MIRPPERSRDSGCAASAYIFDRVSSAAKSPYLANGDALNRGTVWRQQLQHAFESSQGGRISASPRPLERQRIDSDWYNVSVY